MSGIVITALLTSFIICIVISLHLGIRAKSIADMLPLSERKMAHIRSSGEFSASTVATTISLATVILAFFELAEKFGLWLFWSVITTSAGLLFVRLFAKKIWAKISTYDHRPTLNEFLGREYNSKSVRFVSAVCTGLGFLSTFALELIVGSAFFAGLVPHIRPLAVLVILSLAVFLYTAVGGFRAVIISDRIQMLTIWMFIIALSGFYAYYVIQNGGWTNRLENVPQGVLNLSSRKGLFSFLGGIFVMNVPTYLSDIGIWQRIAGSQDEKTVLKGLVRSSIGTAVSWSLIILLACFAFMLIQPAAGGINPLILVIKTVGNDKSILAAAALFFITLGLYGAMLSTSSTQLIAVSHTLYEDILSSARKRSLQQRIASVKELYISRLILIVFAFASIAVVYILWLKGFSIADLVFTIYGAQVGLCPLAIAALLLKHEQLAKLSGWAVAAVSAGFLTGWSSAIYGNFFGKESFVYSSPVSSLFISSVILILGFIFTSNGSTGSPHKNFKVKNELGIDKSRL